MDPFSSSLGDLARAIRSGETTPTALVEAHIRRIETVDPALNAVAVRRYEAAREEARRAEAELAEGTDRGPLHGIPCTVKEFLAVEGLQHTGGLYLRKGHIADRDATIVARLREAGAVILATTNAPEGGLWHETHNRIYGRTANPHDLNRTSGGSSGGEGAIIAAGGSPYGIGSDVGGSIRLPAGFCGVYGHKPTHTLVPNTGHFPEAPPEPYMTCGPLARSAADLMPILRAIAGPDDQDRQTRPWTLGDPERVDVSRLRVFEVARNGQASVSRPMQDAVHTAGSLLASRGARVAPLELPELASAFDIWAVLMSDLGILYDELVAEGDRVPLSLELFRWARGRSRHTGSVLAMVALQRAMERLPDRAPKMAEKARSLGERIRDTLGDDGVILHPTFARVAPRHRTIGIGNPADVGLTAVFNILGVPVTVAPVGTHDGLPTSVQIVGPQGADARTLAVAIALEEATGGWSVVHPRRGPPPRTWLGRLR
ncbi:MAG: amidase [Alphaproteobacteria bacterium]|nr:amidase [Alphaproteobacteria bacterium]